MNEELIKGVIDEAEASEKNVDSREANEAAYTEAIEKLNSYRLNWTFRSIDYILNTEGLAFTQLRSCAFLRDGTPYLDYIRATILIIKAGLVGSKQIEETNSKGLEDKAYEILEDWRENFGSPQILHLLLIHTMETKHFFMGMKDSQIIQHLSYRNLQRDLGISLLKQDLLERTSQAKALQ